MKVKRAPLCGLMVLWLNGVCVRLARGDVIRFCVFTWFFSFCFFFVQLKRETRGVCVPESRAVV